MEELLARGIYYCSTSTVFVSEPLSLCLVEHDVLLMRNALFHMITRGARLAGRWIQPYIYPYSSTVSFYLVGPVLAVNVVYAK